MKTSAVLSSAVPEPTFPADDSLMHTFLEGLHPQHLEVLAKIATKERFGAGQKIFRQYESATGFYLIEDGVVSLDFDLPGGKSVHLQEIRPGEVLGWSWLAAPHQWQFTASAIDSVNASFFPASGVRAECARDARLGYALMERFARVLMERLQATRHKLLVFVKRASRDEDAQQVC